MMQASSTVLEQVGGVGSLVALVTAIVAVAMSWGRRGAFQEMLQRQQDEFRSAMSDQGTAMKEALQHQSDEFEKAIEKLESDRVTNAQLETLVSRMEAGFESVTREFAGFAGRAGIIGDIEYLKKAMAEGFEIQNRARHDLRSEVNVLNGNLEIRVKRCEDHILKGE